MDVNTNGLSTGGYRGGSYYGGGGVPSSGALGEDASDKFFAAPAARKVQFGDSLVGAALPRRTNERVPTPMDPEQALKTAQIVRVASWGIAGLSLFIFAIMFLQPILLPLFTFGACFSGGFGEWLEFSYAVLKASMVPAAITIAFGWIGYFAHRKAKELEDTIAEKTKPKQTPMGLSPALMARLSESHNF